MPDQTLGSLKAVAKANKQFEELAKKDEELTALTALTALKVEELTAKVEELTAKEEELMEECE